MRFLDKLKSTLCVLISLCITAFAMVCMAQRAGVCFDLKNDTALAAALCVMPNGELCDSGKADDTSQKKAKKSTSADAEKEPRKTKPTADPDEPTYPIAQVHLDSGNTSYGNIEINNNTGYQPDVGAILSAELPFELDDTKQVQVLIVHTHTCESYMTEDSSYYSESFYPRTTDNESNVYAVGEAITDSLKRHGISVVHADAQHDNPSYDGAYDRSYETITEYIDKYPQIKVVLDIHRDSMTQQDNTRLKPTFTYKGEKAAQIMIMTGYDSLYSHFPCWEENLNFALKLQNTCESMYEGMTRPLNFGEFTYNMNVNSGSLLIEVGTDANTLSEAVLSGKMLGNALAQVLQKS